LLVQTFLVSQDLKGDNLLVFMVKALEDLAEAALAQTAHDLVPVSKMVTLLADVFVLIVIETVIVDAVRSGRWAFLLLPLLKRKPVNDVVFENLSFLYLPQILREIEDGLARVHREDELLIFVQRAVPGLFDDRGEVGGDSLLQTGQVGRHLLPRVERGLVIGHDSVCLVDRTATDASVVAQQRIFVPVSVVLNRLTLVFQVDRVVASVGGRSVH
jgi:hypothetical protein